MKKSVLAFLTTMFLAQPIYALEMPFYEDDEEFEHCKKITGSWDQCIPDETKRVLGDIKNHYRIIISDPRMEKWRGSIKANAEALKDMYESWLAYRHRVCSLNNKAMTYTGPLVDPRLSCELYQTFFKRDYTRGIANLLQKKKALEATDLAFLRLPEHDEQYTQCINENKPQQKCIDEEFQRSNEEIKNKYQEMFESEYLGKWNNGSTIEVGNYRDMLDSWVAYRNRICSLAVTAYQAVAAKNEITLNECILTFNRYHTNTMSDILFASGAYLEEGMNDDDDGGEAEGKTIEPLKRHIDAGSAEETSLSTSEEKNEAAENGDDSYEKRYIPAWAR